MSEYNEKDREAYEISEILFKSSPFIINIWDSKHNIVRTSPQSAVMFELPNEEEYIKRFYELTPEYQPCGALSREKGLSYTEQAFNEGYAKFEWLHKKLDGELIPTEITLVRFIKDGEAMLAAYTVDLRPVKATMEKVQEAEKRAKLLLDESPVSCYLIDENFQAIDCNRAAVELFVKEPDKSFSETYSEKDISQGCFWDCIHCGNSGKGTCGAHDFLIKNYRHTFPNYAENKEEAERIITERFNEVLNTGVQRFEFIHATLYGEAIPCEVTIAPVEYRGRSNFAVYIRDLRESKKILAEMQKREIAEEENRAKTHFLARMSHEIRTPMNAVLGIAEIQLQKEGHPPETEEAFMRIHNSSNLLLTIINDILDLSKIESGKMEIIPGVYETQSLIADTIHLNLMQHNHKNIDFYLSVDQNMPSYLIGDELRIKQILNNLISNAFKYTEKGMINLSFEAEYIFDTDDIILIICIMDTGQGMEQEQIDSLFDIFARFNTQANRDIEGSGVGLNIIYSLVKMMEGEIEVESTPGKGSTFTVRLPQKAEGKEVLGLEVTSNMQNLDFTGISLKKIARANFEPMPYGRVLAVDDVESNLYVLEGILEPYNIDFEAVESGHQAIAKIESGEEYDIIFMDHMMPELDGIQTTKIIRELGYNLPIVALTANALKDASEIFMSSGFSGFVSKPIDIEQLDKYLAKFIRNKYQPDGIVSYTDLSAYANQKLGLASKPSIALSDALISSFLRDAKKTLDILEPLMECKEFNSDQFKAYTTQVHAIKSALANISRPELSNMAYTLEEAGRLEDIQIITTDTARFLELLKEVVAELMPKDITDETEVDEDLAFLLKNLQAIESACEAYNKKEAKDAVNALSQKPCSKNTKELLDKISAYLLHSDFEEAAALAKEAALSVNFRLESQ